MPRRGISAVLSNMRGRIIAGLLLVLPFVITFWIVYWLYATLDLYVFSPMAWLVGRLFGVSRVDAFVPDWVEEYGSPVAGLIGVGVLLYVLGFFAHSRLAALFDRIVLRVPIVTSIYSAARRMFESLSGTGELARFKRVVLVAFPHPGMRSPGFVTSSCRDEATGKTILGIYMPTTPFPTTGYLLLVPEEEVTDIDWTFEETIQAMVSFGITAPEQIQYYAAAGEPYSIEDVKSKA